MCCIMKTSKHVDNPIPNSASILSVGPGMGGIEKGVEEAGTRIQVVANVEIEAFIIQNAIGLMEKGVVAPAPFWADLTTFNAKPFYGMVDFIFSGFPCQPFSVAGLGKGTEDLRHLFPHLMRIGKECGAKGFFLENVPGLISTRTLDYAPQTKARISHYLEGTRQRMGDKIADRVWNRILRLFGRPALHHVLSELEAAGYTVKWGIYSAEECGAPHQRKRVFILAIKPRHSERSEESQLEDSYPFRNGRRGDHGKNRRPEIQTEGSSDLANTDDIRSGTESRYLPSQGEKTEGSTQGKNRERSGDDTRNICKAKLEYSSNSIQCNDSRKKEEKLRFASNTSGISNPHSNDGSKIRHEQITTRFGNASQKWPAPPGPYQHEWEEPRTLRRSKVAKPGVGCTIDGYNFREDLLRMFGNGVVRQTATKAWIDLWSKLLK